MLDDANNASDTACTQLLDDLLEPERAWFDEYAPGDKPVPRLLAEIGPHPEAEDQSLPTGLALRERWYGFLGNVVWDVFSGNHDVVGPDEKVYHLGSWRGSGSFLADYLNARLIAESNTGLPSNWGPFAYTDFYMGTVTLKIMGGGEADPDADEDAGLIKELYIRLFKRLKARDCEWRFAPPSLGVVRFPKKASADDPATYDPSKALAEESEAAEEKAAQDKLDRQIAEGNAKAFEEAVENPPLIVRAYTEAYGRRPRYN